MSDKLHKLLDKVSDGAHGNLGSNLRDDTIKDRFISFFCKGNPLSSEGSRLYNILNKFPSQNAFDYVTSSLMTAKGFFNYQFPRLERSPQVKKTSDSSNTNMTTYGDDPIFFESLAATASTSLQDFEKRLIDWNKYGHLFFQEPAVQFWSENEGDVVSYSTVNVLRPVILVMNFLLQRHYAVKGTDPEKYRYVGLRGEYSVGAGNGYVDHALVWHQAKIPGQDQRHGPGDQDVLVLFEDKIRGTMLPDWHVFAKLCSRHKKAKLVEETVPELRKMLPQIRKYVFATQTAYAMESDSLTFAAMIWARGKNWKSGSSSGVCSDYAGRNGVHSKKTPHHCKLLLIDYESTPTVNTNPRYILAYLCWLALQDRGITL